MDTTNTDFYAYQFKPVLAFLDSPARGLLIADEVGLGKTIEAGLIWTELRARYDARRLLVLCPAMLREKWRDELRRRFGVDADIMDARGLAAELKRPKSEVQDGKGIICSIQGLRPPREEDEDAPKNPRSALAELLTELAANDATVDLLIVDEAHHLRNPASRTAKLGEMLRDVSEYIILLSATPVNLKSEDLFHLLKLVDPDSFQVKEFFPQVLAANEPLHRARQLTLDTRSGAAEIKQLLRNAREHPPLRKNRQLANLIGEGLSDERLRDREARVKMANRIERINLLRHAVSRTRKAEVTEWRVVREPFTQRVELSEPERNFYRDVTACIQDYADSAGISSGFLLASPQRQVSSCMFAAISAWQNRQEVSDEEIHAQTYEDWGSESTDQNDAAPLIAHLCGTVLPKYDPGTSTRRGQQI